MTRRDALRALERAVEAVDKMGTVLAARECFDLHQRRYMLKAADGSLDAAKALHEALLPGFRAKIESGGFDAYNMARPVDIWTVSLWAKDPMSIMSMFGPMGQDKDPARAWLLAIIGALITQEGGE